MSEEKPKEARVPHVLAKEFRAAEHARAIHAAKGPMLPIADAVKAMKDPAFWANVSTRMHPNDHIEAVPEDGSYFVELFVRSAGPNWAHIEVLREHSFISAASVVEKAKDVKVEWGGPAHKHRVVRISDKAVLKHGFDTPEQANEWLAGNLSAVTA